MIRSRAAAGLLLCCSAVWLSACTAPGRYEAQPVDAAQSAAALLARGKDDAGLRRFMLANGVAAVAFPPVRWGRRELTLLAFYFHPDLDIARARAFEAEAGRIAAMRRPTPSLALDAEHHSFTDRGLSPWTLGFNFDLTIVTAGKREAAQAQAERLADAAWLDLANVAWQVRARAIERHIALFSAQRAVDLAADELDMRRHYARLVQRRLDAGAATRSELSLARMAVDEAELRRLETAQALAASRAGLAAALGISAAKLAELAVDCAAYEQVSNVPQQGDLEAEALVNRIEVRRALMLHAAAEAALRLEVARQYPDIDLRPGFIWDQGDHRWVLGATFPFPLPHANTGPIAQAIARRDIEARNVVALQAAILAEVDSARERCAAAGEQWQRLSALQSERAAELRRSKRRFEAGEADRMDLVAARLEHAVTKRRQLDALVATHLARAALEAAMQRPLDPGEAPPVPYRGQNEPLASGR